MGTPQAEETFLALGEVTNFLRLGFLMYWQRQGFCCLILVQQSFEGGFPDVIAVTHGLSSVGVHVTAIDTSVSHAKTRNTTSITPITAILLYDAFIFLTNGCPKYERKRERERLGSVDAWCINLRLGFVSIYRQLLNEPRWS